MKNTEKTKEQLIAEIAELQKRNKELEISDIARMQKEQILRESEKKYRLLIESSNDMLFTVDLKGNFLFVNKAFKKCLGYSKKEMMGINGFSLVHPDDLDEVKKKFAQFTAGKSLDNIEYRYKTKSGKYIHILNNATPISDSEGNIVAALGIAKDISLRKKMEEELQKAHDELEQRVAVRTDELLKLNKKLNQEIKDRKRMEKALRESEEKYRAIFESFHDVYFRMNKEGLVTIISPSVHAQAGYDPGDILGRPVTDFFLVPEDGAAVIQKIKEAESVNDYEIKLKAKDGSPIEASMSAHIIFGDDGEPAGVEGVLRDIIERKRTEEALKESEEKYRDLVENLTEVIYALKPTGEVLYVSPAVKSLISYSPKEIEGRSFAELIHEEDLPRASKSIQKILEGESASNEYRLKEKSGKIRWIHTSSRPILKGKRVVGVQGILTDITKRKQAEEELQAREAYLDQLIETAQEAIVMADNTGKALRINQEFTRLFGYAQEETVGQNLDELIVPQKLQKNATLITEKVAKGEKVSFEAIRRHKNGRMIAVSVLASPIVIGGKQVGTYGIYRNITERKKAEEQIKASLKEKEILLQEVHHRVKNNMQIISSLLNLQSRHVKDKESLGLFKSSQNRVKSMALIHERLYQSKDFTRIDVADYVQNLTNHLFITYGINKDTIKLKMNIKDIFLDINNAIPCALIINELVSNSLKHAFPNGKKGEIQISMRPLSKDEIELVVGDNGVGMPEDANLKNTKSLGLYLVNMLAKDQLHGEIKLDKTKGTAFRFRLRLKI
ncbi:MAG: PAS domain S-box protein [Candidatus Aminicenantes bacterium]|jgi:PAS domain S-box-containing protein